MSSRDWNTIGVDAARPRWIRWAIPPLLVPLAAIGWLVWRWDSIPARFGHPLVTRTPLHVFGFLIFGEGMAALMVGLMGAIWLASGKPRSQSPGEQVLMAVAYFVSLLFAAIGLMPLISVPGWAIAVVVPPAVLVCIVFVVKAQFGSEDSPDNTPDECWTVAGTYYNPKDPALMVRARAGYGYTFNMANPWAYKILFGFAGGVALLIGFLIWSLR